MGFSLGGGDYSCLSIEYGPGLLPSDIGRTPENLSFVIGIYGYGSGFLGCGGSHGVCVKVRFGSGLELGDFGSPSQIQIGSDRQPSRTEPAGRAPQPVSQPV